MLIIYNGFNKPQKSQGLIFHYSNMDALLKIFSSGKIRLYDLSTMNDPSELSLFKQNWSEAFERYFVKYPAEESNKSYIENTLFRNFDGSQQDTMFAICFSQNGDDLNQWRLYGDNGNGVYIAFDREKLLKKYDKYYLDDIEYFDDVSELCEKLISEEIGYLKRDDMTAYHSFVAQNNNWHKYKYVDYATEKESRLTYVLRSSYVICNNTITKLINALDFKDVMFDAKNGIVRRYIELDLDSSCIDHICIGPLNNTTYATMKLLCAKFSIDIEDVYISNKHYRVV